MFKKRKEKEKEKEGGNRKTSPGAWARTPKRALPQGPTRNCAQGPNRMKRIQQLSGPRSKSEKDTYGCLVLWAPGPVWAGPTLESHNP